MKSILNWKPTYTWAIGALCLQPHHNSDDIQYNSSPSHVILRLYNYKLCFGLVGSNEKKTDHFSLFVCSFKHLFASADANRSTTRQN